MRGAVAVLGALPLLLATAPPALADEGPAAPMSAASTAAAAPSAVAGAPAGEGATGDPSGDTTGPGDDVALTPEQVAEQLAAADELRAALGRSDAALAAATQELQRRATAAAAALEAAARAEQEERAARAETALQLRRLANLQVMLDDSERELGRWARNAYSTGGQLADWGAWLTALEGRTTGDVSHDLGVLAYLGRAHGVTLDRVQVRTSAQRDAAVRAAVAAARTDAAAAKARTARDSADRLLTAQRQALTALEQARLRTVGKAEVTRQRLLRLGTAQALVKEAELAAAVGPTARRLAVPAAGCQGGDLGTYANGRLPTTLLCPVWGAPSALLRADAARALSALSQEFARDFGRPLCVTDSYRPYAAQVAVRAAKPGLAAVPGTSNHGWATAVDLCGGVQSFGTAEHAWMLAHAPLHGWFHPTWAGPSGSKPEPWHWEYGG